MKKLNMHWFAMGVTMVASTGFVTATGLTGSLHAKHSMSLRQSASQSQKLDNFTVADLEKMVNELAPYLPQDPRLIYPVRCVVEKNDDVNAYASPYFDPAKGKDAKPQANITVLTGALKHFGEVRILRAVIAHELAHLSKQHLGSYSNAQDVDLMTTRQQEFEADAYGAIVLEKAGFKRQDMVDMLLILGELEQKIPGVVKLMGDHADCSRRAAAVDASSLVLRSLVSFGNGEAFLDARSFNRAMEEFDKAAADAPKFYEARYNAAFAAIQDYYSRIADEVKSQWYTPDFGANLLRPKFGSRAGKLTDGDRRLYAQAEERVRKLIDLDPKRTETLELQGLTLVLDPDARPTNLKEGISVLEGVLKSAIGDAARLRIANNLAIGYQRSGDVNSAMEKMLGEQRRTTMYNPYLASNLGAQSFPAKFKPDGKLAEAVIFTYLSNTHQKARGYATTLNNYRSLCSAMGLKARDITAGRFLLCRVFSIFDGGNEFSLSDDLSKVVQKIGKAQNAQKYDERYQGLFELSWQGGNFTIFGETRKDEIDDRMITEAIRVSSFNEGSYFLLKSEDSLVNVEYKISVGMPTSEFYKILNEAAGEKRMFARMGKLEEWRYYPAFNIGILVKGDKIVGITTTPAADAPAE